MPLQESWVGGTAAFSEDGVYRYSLTRRWSANGPTLMWVMLNPSTATDVDDDPTIRRCVDFSKRDGYGALVVTNLCALRATDPADLYKAADPVGPLNRETIRAWLPVVSGVILAWGAHGARLRDRLGLRLPQVVRDATLFYQTPYCLGTTKSGDPKHPLYLRADTPFVPYP